MSHFILLNESITTAQAAVIKTPIIDLDDFKSLGLYFTFIYGSSGTNLKAWVQTTFDNGSTWFDIAQFAATTANKSRMYNLSALTAVSAIATPGSTALADDTSVDGFIGNGLRVVLTTTGTYVGTTVSIHALARE